MSGMLRSMFLVRIYNFFMDALTISF